MIGRITRVPLREVWKHEAKDFTKWLEDNIDQLNETTGLGLIEAKREQSAGDFYVDLVAEDEEGHTVVIENQLGKSDNDHLGKILTYMTSMEADRAIWIVGEPRPEHVRAITWLNESADASFFMLKAEAARIGESAPALLLTLIVGPSEESRVVGETKKDLAERHSLRMDFWIGLLDRAKERTKLHANISPGHYYYIGTGAGKSGLSYVYAIMKNEALVELYIDKGKESEEENKEIFNRLFENKNEIENAFGGSLE